MKQSTLFPSNKSQARMPRPGLKPYDCVKRAWHSERHQPIRGNLIHEIFRVANEIHNCDTKKNKEYQEKLPVVVLRVEEILYSKANSESEYMDLKTLVDRTNDAIDTIIRRDEHTETGEYLRPCIEAALNLGCSLTKASRSQRNKPMCYLSRRTEDVPKTSPVTMHNRRDHTTKLQCMSENVPSTSKKQCLEQHQHPSHVSVYPLYYGNHIQRDKSQHGFRVSHKSVFNTSGPAIVAVVQNGDPEKPCTNKCDLSLRLGPLPIAPPSFENGQVQETEVRSKLIVQNSQKGKKCGTSRMND